MTQMAQMEGVSQGIAEMEGWVRHETRPAVTIGPSMTRRIPGSNGLLGEGSIYLHTFECFGKWSWSANIKTSERGQYGYASDEIHLKGQAPSAAAAMLILEASVPVLRTLLAVHQIDQAEVR